MLPVLLSVALAQSLSADPEMVVPRFSHDALPGMHGIDTHVPNTLRVGTSMQYLRNPVTGYRVDQELGAIVSDRLVSHTGVSWDFAHWGSASVVLPLNLSWRGESHEDLTSLETTGFGVGDLTLGAAFVPFKSRYLHVGVHGDLSLPTGRKDALVSEQSLRARGGLSLLARFHERVQVGGEVAVVGRPIIITNADLDLGPELWMAQSAKVSLPWVPVAFTQTLQARAGFTNLLKGGGENGLEVLGGVQGRVQAGFNTTLAIDVMAGRGTNQGFGTTDLRLLAAITLERAPGRPMSPDPAPILQEDPLPPVPPVPIQDKTPPPEPGVVSITEDRLLLDRPVAFVVDTAILEPSALPVLRSVAEALQGDYRIQHVVIEGHASAEGDFAYNYALSTARAEAIYKRLLLEGVHPERMSYRGQGEVVPRAEGDSEEALQRNRRVEFHIVSRFHESIERMQEYLPVGVDVAPYEPRLPPATGRVPWTGEAATFPVPQVPAPAEDAPKEEEGFDDTEEDFDFEDDAPR